MIKMKRKELCYLLICVMLCRPLLVFATGDQTKASAQTEVQEAGRSGADSTLGGLTAGAELVGSGADLGDLGAAGILLRGACSIRLNPSPKGLIVL